MALKNEVKGESGALSSGKADKSDRMNLRFEGSNGDYVRKQTRDREKWPGGCTQYINWLIGNDRLHNEEKIMKAAFLKAHRHVHGRIPPKHHGGIDHHGQPCAVGIRRAEAAVLDGLDGCGVHQACAHA